MYLLIRIGYLFRCVRLFTTLFPLQKMLPEIDVAIFMFKIILINLTLVKYFCLIIVSRGNSNNERH